MSNLTKLFEYEGNKVTFKNENGIVYVNATQMAKKFGKKPNDYLRLPFTSELIDACARKSRTSNDQLVITRMGSTTTGGGTWLHEDIALDFAQWLSIDFRLWCNDRIKELLTTGTTTIVQSTSEDHKILEAFTLLTNRIAQKEEELQQAKETLLIQAPKVEYVNKVLASESCHNTTTIAKEIGYSAKALNKILKALKVQYEQDGHWVLYAPYQAKGFTKTRTHNYYDSEGNPKTKIKTVWTEKGREFIHHVIKGNPGAQLRIAN